MSIADFCDVSTQGRFTILFGFSTLSAPHFIANMIIFICHMEPACAQLIYSLQADTPERTQISSKHATPRSERAILGTSPRQRPSKVQQVCSRGEHLYNHQLIVFAS